GTLAEDLARRDFTVNAMAVALRELPGGDVIPGAALRASLVDPHGGIDDLDAGILRAVSPAAFEDDPLRAWRGARFAAELRFALKPGTHDLIAAVVPRLPAHPPAPERVS